jgi:dTDP-4-amino-4,6-dideoxygalactose transaminase
MNRNTEPAPNGSASPGRKIPFARPSIDEREEEAVLRVLRSGWLTTASECLAFEREFASAVGTRHAVAVNSGTAGLHLALEAMGVSPGDRVVTTPYTFTASAEVIRYLDADPLFVDIREDDLNLDPDEVDSALRHDPKISAAVPVHVGGHACAMDQIVESCAHNGVRIVEDAAHAFPGTSGGRALGTIGDAGVFSFYATKTLTTGEGGMIVTDDDALARRVSVMRLHGIDREVWDRYTSTRPSWEYQVVEAGYKYNMPDILAAIGRVQLEKSIEMNERRRAIAAAYHRGFADRDYLRLPVESRESSWHLFVIRIDPDRLMIDRDEFIRRLADCGIGTSVHYIPLHIMPYYRDRYGLRPEDFPVSLQAYQRAISLPIYPGLHEESVQDIIHEVIRIGDDALRR